MIIANMGGAASGAFKTEVLFDPRQFVSVIDETVGDFPAGDQKTFRAVTEPGGNCFDPDCTICATVDVGDQVPEVDETNNQLCRTRPG